MNHNVLNNLLEMLLKQHTRIEDLEKDLNDAKSHNSFTVDKAKKLDDEAVLYKEKSYVLQARNEQLRDKNASLTIENEKLKSEIEAHKNRLNGTADFDKNGVAFHTLFGSKFVKYTYFEEFRENHEQIELNLANQLQEIKEENERLKSIETLGKYELRTLLTDEGWVIDVKPKLKSNNDQSK
jgi:predicted RNase H-like nuclease (RuvC/YqgF family)